MKNELEAVGRGASRNADGSSRGVWWVVAGCVTALLLGMLFTFFDRHSQPAATNIAPDAAADSASSSTTSGNGPRRNSRAAHAPSAEEIVASKVARFVESRRELVRRMAEHFKTVVPEKYEEFFKLAASGDWERLQALFKELEQGPRTEAALPLWQAIKETYGVVEQAHKWPAQGLLDYGQAVLGSLRPRMVYLGGSDPGRFIPTLLNETGDGARQIVLTQNALADASYLRYVNYVYADQVNGLTAEDSQRAFQEYITDAQRRLQHDQQFPEASRQLRWGEDIRVTDNRVQVSGKVAVMAINEALLTMFIQKNPTLSFGLEESFPLPSTYVNAAPLGPIMEINPPDPQNALTAETASQSLAYWRSTAQTLAADPGLAETPEALTAWARLAAAQGNLFASRDLPGEAEQAYRIAAGLAPAEPTPITQLAELLARTGRVAEANRLLDDFAAKNPAQVSQVEDAKKRLATMPKS